MANESHKRIARHTHHANREICIDRKTHRDKEKNRKREIQTDKGKERIRQRYWRKHTGRMN